MQLKDELRDLRDAWQIFCQWDERARHDAIVQSMTYTLVLAVFLAGLIGVLNSRSPVPTEALCVMIAGASGMLLLTFCSGVMFVPSVLAAEARILRERYGDTIRRPL